MFAAQDQQLWWNLPLFSMQILPNCIPTTNLVARSWWKHRVPFPQGYIQPLLPSPPRESHDESRSPEGPGPWPSPRMEHQTGPVPVFDVKRPKSRLPVLLEWAREMGQPPCWWFFCWEFVGGDEDQVFDDADWLHTHKRWFVLRLCADIAQVMSSNLGVFFSFSEDLM